MSLFADIFRRLIMKFKEHIWSFMLIIALTVIVCRNILFSSDFPAGTDMLGWVAGISYLSRDFKAYYIWLSHSFGVVGMVSSPYAILATLNVFFNNSLTVVKTFIFTSFLLSGVWMYLFTWYHVKRQVPSLLSSIMFMINPYYIGQWSEGHLNFAFAYGLGPLLFLAYDRMLESAKAKSIVTFSTVATLIVFARPDALIYYMPFLIFFVVLKAFFTPSRDGKRLILTNFLKTTTWSMIFIFFSLAFQLLPYLWGVQSPYSPQTLFIPMEKLEKYSKGLFETFLGISSELGYISPQKIYFPYLPFSRYFLLVPVLLAFSAMLFRKDRLTLTFILSGLTSVFLAKGTYPPFGGVYLWLWLNIPYFKALSVPSRWLMVTWLSYSLLAGITFNVIYTKLQRFSILKIDGSQSYSFLMKNLRHLPQILFILLLLPIFLGNWYTISEGLQTWRPAEQAIRPYLWVADQQSDFRVATVPYHQTYMKTSIGFEQDLGYQSSLFHNKPVIRTGEADPRASDFVSYTYRLVRINGTDNLMKILGAFNVRYLVVAEYLPTEALPPGYSPSYQHYFFSRQKGLQLVYVYENSTVYENEFWTPHIFAVSNYAIVVGGREAFTALTTVDNFNLSDWNLLFADQIADQLGVDQLLELINESPLLIFVNSEPLDLTMLTLEDAIRIKAVDYAYPSTNKYEHWINDDWWTSMGMLVLNTRVLLTSGNLSLSIPVNVENSGEYDIWIRLLYGESRGNLSAKIDNTELGSILPYARHYSGLRWVKIGSARLERGQHDLTLTNNKSTIEWAQGDSTNIDEILLVKPQEFKLAINKTTQLLQQSPARIINIIEGEQMFKWATTPHFTEWWTAKRPFNASGGWVASTTSENTWIPLQYSILRDGRYTIALRIKVGPDQGTLRIVVDDTEYPSVNATSQEHAFKWITRAPITLQSGNHTFELYGEGKLEIDQIAIYSLNQDEDETTLGDIFKTDRPQTTISYEKINPTMYTVHVETDTPFFLVFSEAYHNLWKAYVDGEEIQSIPAYSFINTFQISKTGEYDIVIEFIGQRYVVYGGIISIISITLTIIYLIFGTKINHFIVRKLKLKQKREMKNGQ